MTTLTRQQQTNLRLYYSLLVMLQQHRGGVRHSRSKGEYIYNANGRRVPEVTIQKKLDGIVSDFQKNAERLATRLDNGRLTTAQWQERMRREIKDLHRTQYIVGKGGVENMTPRDWGRLGADLRHTQYKALDGFALDIADGKLSPAQIRARSDLYMNASNKQYWRGKTEGKIAAGFVEEQRFLGAADHCEVCEGHADGERHPIGSLPDPGEECLGTTNCKCRKVYYKADGTTAAIPTPKKGTPEFASKTDAEQYAHNTLGVKSNYNLADVDQANSANRATAKIQDVYDGPASKRVVEFDDSIRSVGNARGRRVRINPLYGTDAEIAASEASHMRRYRRSQKSLKNLQSQLDDGWFDLDPDYKSKVINKIEKLKNTKKPSGRFGVADNLEDVIIHEYGHMIKFDLESGYFPEITDFLTPSKMRKQGVKFADSLSAKLDKIATENGSSISEYATTNSEEYFAESFLSFIKGDTKNIDSRLLSIFRKITK